MPILATVGSIFSEVLDKVIFAFPSPRNASHLEVEDGSSSNGRTRTLVDMITEPGEPKALAGGVGPLNFAGSGYGVVLVLTVGYDREEALTKGNPVKPDSAHSEAA